MSVTRRSLLRSASALAALPLLPAHAQDWPTRPLRILVGTAAGGSPDIVSRLLGEKLAERLGQTITIENNTQGAGAVAQQAGQSRAARRHDRADDDGRLSAADGAAQSRLPSARRLLVRDAGLRLSDGVRGCAGFPDQVVPGFAREGQGQSRAPDIFDHRDWVRSTTC